MTGKTWAKFTANGPHHQRGPKEKPKDITNNHKSKDQRRVSQMEEITPDSATTPPLGSDVECVHTAPKQQMTLPMGLNAPNPDRIAHFDPQNGEAMESEEDKPIDNLNYISERPQLIKTQEDPRSRKNKDITLEREEGQDTCGAMQLSDNSVLGERTQTQEVVIGHNRAKKMKLEKSNELQQERKRNRTRTTQPKKANYNPSLLTHRTAPVG